MLSEPIVAMARKRESVRIEIEINLSRPIAEADLRQAVALGVDFISAHVDGSVSARYERKED